MAKRHSFVITLSNNRTESEGVEQVLDSADDLFHPDLIGRKELLEMLELPTRFLRAFDLVRVSGASRRRNELQIKDPRHITLVELKTTKKRLPANPYGFFFGATKNELDLAKKLGEQFNFAFVCLHPETPSVKLLTLKELEPLIQRKRTQFQINLKSSATI